MQWREKAAQCQEQFGAEPGPAHWCERSSGSGAMEGFFRTERPVHQGPSRSLSQ